MATAAHATVVLLCIGAQFFAFYACFGLSVGQSIFATCVMDCFVGLAEMLFARAMGFPNMPHPVLCRAAHVCGRCATFDSVVMGEKLKLARIMSGVSRLWPETPLKTLPPLCKPYDDLSRKQHNDICQCVQRRNHPSVYDINRHCIEIGQTEQMVSPITDHVPISEAQRKAGVCLKEGCANVATHQSWFTHRQRLLCTALSREERVLAARTVVLSRTFEIN